MADRFLGPKYTLEKIIAFGSNATIYSGIDTVSKETIAAKVVRRGSPVDIVKEAEVMRKLQHPHIIPIRDFIQEENRSYLVVPLVRRGSLYDEFQSDGENDRVMPIQRSTKILQQIGDALVHMHNEGIGHFDVTLSNILLLTATNVWLTDFGSSQVFTEITRTTNLTNQYYQAPEQHHGIVIPENDQYSLGIIAYKLLTGKLPFRNTPDKILDQHLFEEPMSLECMLESGGYGELVTNFTRSFDPIVRRALSKKPEDRYQSISAFVEAYKNVYKNVCDEQRSKTRRSKKKSKI